MESVKYFKALSDETRLRILLLLSKRSLCVCQMQEILELPQSKISKHLSKMRDQKIVKSFQEGKFVKYELGNNAFLKSIIEQTKETYSEDPQFIKDEARIYDFDDLIGGEDNVAKGQ